MKQIFDYVQSFTVIALIMAGIGGVSYHLFKEEGWIETALGNIWELHVQYPLIAIPLTVAAVVCGKMWRENRLAGRVSRLPDVFIYILMAAGAYFITYYILYDSL